ncbi:transmembrane protease serine 5 [Anser cygnoides]|uniref:transmembrane protease serine 5 n=1 Tax=Anser cygnoides TaxID=8845 RepID=UPI0034D15418
MPPPDQGFAPPQEPGAIPECAEGEEDEPVVRGAPGRVSFRINSDSSLLEARVRGRPGWLLACHERWWLRLGTQLCRHLGALRMTHQKGVNLTDVRVKDAQEFIQLRPGQEGSLEDMWQVRSTCESGRIVALKCSECGLHRGALRVVGGMDAAPGRWPWQVSVRHGSRHHCGGSVLAPSWIVTAAHCVHSYRRLHASGWLVGAGVARGSIEQEAGVPVEKVIYHPLYNGSSLDYDIALMKLRIPLNFSGKMLLWPPPTCKEGPQPLWAPGGSMPSSTMLPAVPGKVAVGAEASRGLVQGCFTSICGAEQLCRLSSAGWQLHSLGCACTAWPRCPGAHHVPFPADAICAVCLPPSHRDLFQGTPCWVSGWGYTRPDQAQLTETLQEALVPLISTRRCNSSCMYKGELTARMLCAGYPQGKIDACQGDSGGPLVCQDELTWRLVGVVSWGQGCAEPNHPGVYTNVAQLLPWIYRTTEIY